MAERSPNYPAIGLREAISLVRALYSVEKRTSVSPAVMAKAWGYAGLNGAARTKISGVKKYGFLEGTGSAYRVSNLAMKVILHEENSEEYIEAIREAALTPGLFQALYETHRDASDTNLRNHLMLSMGFTEAGARHLIKSFRETLEVAALDGTEPTRQPPPRQDAIVEAGPLTAVAALAPASVVAEKVYRWPLSPTVAAEVRLTGNPDQRHIDMLQRYLDIVKSALSVESSTDTTETEEP